MIKDFAGDITHVTYKEVMLMWNCSERSAALRLNVIRASLGKKLFHKLTVHQFCKAEDISIEEFNQAINDRYNKAFKKAS